MAKNKRKLPYLTSLVKKFGPKIGAKVIIEPEWGVVSQLHYKNGTVRSLRYLSLDINHIASADIAKDKDYAKFFMKKMGYPVAAGRTVFSQEWAKKIHSNRNISYAIKYAQKLGYPLIVKPNSKSQGSGVFLVRNVAELRDALQKIFKDERVALLEEYLPGRDYRIVVLDNKIISAYERIPLSVVGDGKKSILSLLQQKQKNFILKGRDTKINFKDSRMKIKLASQGYAFKSILPKNKKIFLLDNANLSTGGDAIDMTSHIHKSFSKIAVQLTKDMGLRMAGVDIMLQNGEISQDPRKCSYYIIEINAAPGLDHYATTGRAQKKKVETMYLEVLKALGKKD